MSISRRCILHQNNAKYLSTATQPAVGNAESELKTEENVSKDKLYSRLEIELRGIEPEVMRSYAWFAKTSAEHLGITVGNW